MKKLALSSHLVKKSSPKGPKPARFPRPQPQLEIPPVQRRRKGEEGEGKRRGKRDKKEGSDEFTVDFNVLNDISDEFTVFSL